MEHRNGPSRRAVIAGAALAAAAPALAHAMGEPPAQTPKTFLLVHGAWHGGWCWQRVADRLTAKGHTVHAPTLTGLCERSHLLSDSIDLTTHIDDIVNEMKWKDLDGIVLVGHSYGGMVITGVAERMSERIASIVYLDAFVPGDNQALADLVPPEMMVEISGPTAPAINAEGFNVNPADRAWVDSKLTPQPVKTLTQKLAVTGAYQSIAKKTYVRATASPSPFFDAFAARLRADASWSVIDIDCGHDVMIDRPDDLTALLEAAV